MTFGDAFVVVAMVVCAVGGAVQLRNDRAAGRSQTRADVSGRCAPHPDPPRRRLLHPAPCPR